MKKNTIIFLFVLFSQIFPQGKDSQENTGLIILNDVIVFVPALLSTMYFHEIGHYTMAKVFGANDVKFGLFRSKQNGGFQIGWTQLNDSLSHFGKAMFDIGGVLFSRGFSELSKLTIRSGIFPTTINRYFAMTYLIGRFDFTRYVVQDALINLFDGTGSDMAALVSEIAGRSTGWRTLTYTSLLAVGILDLVLGWDEIEYHWSILTGKNYKKEKEEEKFRIGIYPNRESINIAFVLNF